MVGQLSAVVPGAGGLARSRPVNPRAVVNGRVPVGTCCPSGLARGGGDAHQVSTPQRIWLPVDDASRAAGRIRTTHDAAAGDAAMHRAGARRVAMRRLLPLTGRTIRAPGPSGRPGVVAASATGRPARAAGNAASLMAAMPPAEDARIHAILRRRESDAEDVQHMSQLMDQVAGWIEQIILALGYPGITLVMLIENLFPPIPSELVMPFAGFLVADGKLDFAGIVVAGTLGSVLGALALYYIGLWGGEAVLRPFIRRFGRWFMTSEDDLDRAIGTFERYGEVMVFVGRLIPIIRSLISLPAGMQRMALPKFLLFTTIGSALWTTLLSYAGLVLGQNWEQVLGIIESYQRVVAVILVIAVLGFFAWKLRQRQATRSA